MKHCYRYLNAFGLTPFLPPFVGGCEYGSGVMINSNKRIVFFVLLENSLSFHYKRHIEKSGQYSKQKLRPHKLACSKLDL